MDTHIANLLRNSHAIAIVGLSPQPHRDSYGVAQYLQAAGYRIIPINPVVATFADAQILGERCYSSLTEAAQALGSATIDIVDIFRNSAAVPPVVKEAIAIGAKAVWMQLGVAHATAALEAEAAGLAVVQDRCIKIEHRHLTLE